ncbi:MAG: hypothetical protein R3C32_08835 [Chloroflexota bacterium]
MLDIGRCDYCGEFCATVGLRNCEDFAFPNGWVPTSVRDRHRRLVERRYDCAVEWRHLGPYHDRWGRALTRCLHCGQGSPSRSPTSSCGTSTMTAARPASHAGGRPAAAAAVASARRVTRVAPLAARPAGRPDGRRRPRPRRGGAAHTSGDPCRSDGCHRPPRCCDSTETGAAGGPLVTPLTLWTMFLPSGTIPASEWDAGALRAAAGDEGDDDLERALAAPGRGHEALMRILRGAAGPFVVTRSEVVIAERPLRVLRDHQGWPHAETGPALVWGDGLTVHAWHGTTVPAWMIEEPDRITPESIDAERNIEVRRMLLDRYGADRYVRASGATLVHEDETGRLWRKTLGGEPSWHRWRASRRSGEGPDEAMFMVEVRNSTPEPDGTHRTYLLRVPPSVITAREAVAWTFGLAARDYAPAVET